MTNPVIDQIPGTSDLIAWFGRFPRFHDAYVQEFQIHVDGTGMMKIKAFRTTDQVDDKGFFVLDKHFVATFHFEEISSVNLSNFMPGEAILYELDFKKLDDVFEIALESSYGFGGTLLMKRIRLEFTPQQP